MSLQFSNLYYTVKPDVNLIAQIDFDSNKTTLSFSIWKEVFMFYSLWNNVSFCVSSVLRDSGHFGNVTIYWQLFANDTPLEAYQEFLNTSGSIVFHTGEKTKPLVLEAISDKIPEFNEFYELRLMNISGKVNISSQCFSFTVYCF